MEVEFVLKDNVFESIKFRALGHRGVNYLKSENELEQNLTKQYQAVIDHLVGKPLSAIREAYPPVTSWRTLMASPELLSAAPGSFLR